MLIGLNGRLGAGKDTAADRIELLVDGRLPVKRVAFANPLKDSAAGLFDISRDELEWMKLDTGVSISVRVPLGPAPDVRYRTVGFTGRQYLERYGTEAHRDIFGDSFWLDQALPRDPYVLQSALWLVTDCRFPNEAERVRELGGIVIEFVGPNGREGNGHPSDTPLAEELIDYMVTNHVHDDEFAILDEQLGYILAASELTLVQGKS